MFRKVCHTGLPAVLLIASGFSQATFKIDTEAAIKHVEALASPEMEGRKSGMPGARKAALYIADQFRALGLEPLGDGGTYLQQYTFPSFQFTGPCGLWITESSEQVALRYGEEFYIFNSSGAGEFEGEVVFAGYGISSRERSYDDYEGLDVANKVVLAMEGAPGNASSWPVTFRAPWGKGQEALRRGAKALLLFPDPDKGRQLPEAHTWSFSKQRSTPNLLTAKIDAPVADRLLSGSGWSAGQLKKDITARLKPHSIALGTRARLRADVKIVDETLAWNVVGVIRGTSKSVADEAIVLGGHYDHGGVDPDGSVFTGAEDDASGTALTIEIARAMMRSDPKPLRSVVFGAWAAEEQGFSGHEHFLKHTPFPPERWAAAFWLDNAGLGDESFNAYGAYFFPSLYNYLARLRPENLRKNLRPGAIGASGFQELGIPSLFTHASGPHAYNHTPYDLPRLISRQALQSIGDFVHTAAHNLASAETLPYTRPDITGYWLRSAPVATASLHDWKRLESWKGSLGPPLVDERRLPELAFISVDASKVDLAGVAEMKKGLVEFEVGAATDFSRISANPKPSAGLALENAAESGLRLWWELGARALVISPRSRQGLIDQATKLGFAFIARDPDVLKELTAPSAIMIMPVDRNPIRAESVNRISAQGALLALEFPAQTEDGAASDPALLQTVLDRLEEARKLIPNDRILLSPAYLRSGAGIRLSDVVSRLREQGKTRAEVGDLLGGNLLRVLKARSGS